MKISQTWRWFGPEDPISLQHINQAGATGIVNALHDIPYGKIWEYEAIMERKELIESENLTWEVVESVPLHDDIKLKKGNYELYINNYKQSLKNLAKAGIKNVCYNFMLVLDWSRTNLNEVMEDNSTAMSFNLHELIAFDLKKLSRTRAESDYSQTLINEAIEVSNDFSEDQWNRIANSILTGFWSNKEENRINALKSALKDCENVKKVDLRIGLANFLKEIIPLAEELGIRMAIHPDDPPFSIFGLPRVVSTEEDLDFLLNVVDSPSNGLTFCTGSLGANQENNLSRMIKKYVSRVNFAHLRNVVSRSNFEFFESNHLEGNVDMFQIMSVLAAYEDQEFVLPMRPDHGHRMLDDLQKEVIQGYSAIGRLRGLAELRGLEMGIKRSMQL